MRANGEREEGRREDRTCFIASKVKNDMVFGTHSSFINRVTYL
jgi:hypothetical protein